MLQMLTLLLCLGTTVLSLKQMTQRAFRMKGMEKAMAESARLLSSDMKNPNPIISYDDDDDEEEKEEAEDEKKEKKRGEEASRRKEEEEEEEEEDIWFFDKSVGFSFQRDKQKEITQGWTASEDVDEYLQGYQESDTKMALTKFLRQFSASPLDSVSTVRFKAVKASLGLLILLLTSIFTLSYYIFPGSFLQYNAAGQYLTRIPLSSTESPAYLEVPEFSESGAVIFFDTDIPLPKTTVTVLDGRPPQWDTQRDESMLSTFESQVRQRDDVPVDIDMVGIGVLVRQLNMIDSR